MKVTVEKKYLVWVLLFICVLIIGSQISVTYRYKDLNNDIADFIDSEIKNESIIRIVELHYTPGKGTYMEICLESKRKFPLFIEDQVRKGDSISVDQTITKQSMSKEFVIENKGKPTKFVIRTLKSEEKFRKIFSLSMAIMVSIAFLLKYNIKFYKSD
jgi:hypothetical protein